MKKNIIILFITFNLVLNFKNSMAGCLKYLDKDLSSTKIQLEKFSCKKIKLKKFPFNARKVHRTVGQNIILSNLKIYRKR